jgi:hypothetical protein
MKVTPLLAGGIFQPQVAFAAMPPAVYRRVETPGISNAGIRRSKR